MVLKNFISIDDCEVGAIYKLRSRNLHFGVYTLQKTFIGIRTKFECSFLDHELHVGVGGTASPTTKIGYVPSTITLVTHLGTFDKITGLAVEFDKPVIDGGRGWYFTNNGESSEDIFPILKSNDQLYDYLRTLISKK